MLGSGGRCVLHREDAGALGGLSGQMLVTQKIL